MPATIVDESREALENKVADGEKALNRALSELTTDLGKYGFKGRVKLHLTVGIDHDTFGKDNTVVERSITLNFRR